MRIDFGGAVAEQHRPEEDRYTNAEYRDTHKDFDYREAVL
jgi:hypothetical protein